jgi:protein-S-isoprenylcysteine O-methyltransferase Ste14
MGAGAAVGAIIGALVVRKASIPHATFDTAAGASILLWVLFFGYWAIESRNSAPTKNAESPASTSFHQVVLTSALLLLFLPLMPQRWLPHNAAVVAIGLSVQAGFALLGVWARLHLGRNWSAEVRIAAGHELVSSGPYHLVRHPIYAAMLGMFLGSAIATGRCQSLAAVLILALAYRRKIRLEEEILHETFGDAFEQYRGRSWALVPGLF